MEESSDTYRLKKVQWDGKTIPLVMQNINGPCPLLGICNILLLQGKIRIHTDFSMVTYEQLVGLLGDLLLSQKPPSDKELEQNYNQNVADAIALFPTLQFGLDVNVRFCKILRDTHSITDFEFTRELTVFDLFNIRLVHGWLVSPEDQEEYEAVGKLSYNEVVEKLVHLAEHESKPGSDDDPSIQQERIISRFMNNTASQLTPHGLEQLQNQIVEGEFAVFFRNNHFSVLHKHSDMLYLLVTDQGYLYQQNIMWELFDSVGILRSCVITAREFSLYNPEENTPEGIVIANEMKDDEALAAQLQKEEQEAQLKASEEARKAQEQADHEFALRLQQGEDIDAIQPATQPIAQPAPIAQPMSQPSTSTAVSAQSGPPTSLEELYRAHQQGAQLTEEQTRQLNTFLRQAQNQNSDCTTM